MGAGKGTLRSLGGSNVSGLAEGTEACLIFFDALRRIVTGEGRLDANLGAHAAGGGV